MTDALRMFTVYDNPLDYPGKFVVRQWDVGLGHIHPCPDPFLVAGTLAECRELLTSMGLVALARSVDDEPPVVETWL